jgi:hypothetical protein
VVWRLIAWPAGFWLTVSAGLAVVVAYQLSHGFPPAPTVIAAPSGAPPLDPAKRPTTPPRLPAADAVEQITARPLFSERRRPFVPVAAPAEETAELTQSSVPLELAGTFLTDTDRAALLLVAGGPPAWLRRGQLIEGWRIEAIEQDRVQLSKDKQQQILPLRADIAVPRTARASIGEQVDDATSRELDSEAVDKEAASPE